MHFNKQKLYDLYQYYLLEDDDSARGFFFFTRDYVNRNSHGQNHTNDAAYASDNNNGFAPKH